MIIIELGEFGCFFVQYREPGKDYWVTKSGNGTASLEGAFKVVDMVKNQRKDDAEYRIVKQTTENEVWWRESDDLA